MLTEEMLREQRWELYHTAEDFSECNDLSEQYPEKVRELAERWWAEAGQHNVLPLDARRQGRMLAPSRPSASLATATSTTRAPRRSCGTAP